VILESAVEATHAVGGILIAEDGGVIEVGEPEAGGDQLEFELVAGRRESGRLVLVGQEFDQEDRETAVVLVGQAVVALDARHSPAATCSRLTAAACA
jgi:hypothetical protein